MRKITENAVVAFFNNYDFNRDNTSVSYDYDTNTATMRLHGNLIAKKVNGTVSISNCGWETTTTKERLNGILNRLNISGLYQKAFVWYWKGDIEFPDNEMVEV